MNDSSLRILQPSLEVSGVIHPHFIDEKIEVRGQVAQVAQLVGDRERIQTQIFPDSRT